MTGQSKHQAWPDKQYAGQAELFEEYECDLQTWLIEKGHREWMKLEDPSKYPRFFQSKRPLAKLYLVYYNLWAVAGTDTRLYPRSRPALPDPV